MNFVNLLYAYPSNTRKIEKRLIKIIRNRWSIKFIETNEIE